VNETSEEVNDMATTPSAPPNGCSTCYRVTNMIRTLEDMDPRDDWVGKCPEEALEATEAAIAAALEAARALLAAHEADMGGPQTEPSQWRDWVMT